MIESAKIKIEKIDPKNLESVLLKCTGLAEKMDYPSFFCATDWLRVVSENINKDDLFVIVAKHNREIKAVLPLEIRKNSLGGKDLYFLGSKYYPDPIGLIVDAENRSKFVNLFKKYLFSLTFWDRIYLNCMLEEEALAWGKLDKVISTQPFKILPNSFDEILSKFKKKKRYNLKRLVKKAFEEGCEFEISDQQESHNEIFKYLFVLHNKRAKERDLKSSFQGNEIENLHCGLVNGSSFVRLFGLRLDDQLIAVVYGFVFCNRFFYYQVAHDPDHGDLSPGAVLLYLVIEECCNQGITEFNFLQGNESYKGVWTNESRALYQVSFSSKNWRTFLLSGFEISKSLLKRLIRFKADAD